MGDHVTLALDSEQKLLEAARAEYLQMEDEGKKLREELMDKRAVMSQDTGARRLVMKKDAQSLKPHLQPPPELQRDPPHICEDSSAERRQETFQLLHRTTRHRDKSLLLIERIKADSKAALTRTEDCLEKRTDELAALERELKSHMAECDTAISVAGRSIERSSKRADPTDLEKKEKLMRDEALLHKLKEHKNMLHTDIQNKFIELEIDNKCRRVTPVKACDPEHLDKQNAQANQQGQGLRNSASAPSLLSAAGTSNVTGTKLPSLGTMDSFSRDKLGTSSTKFTSASPNSTTSTGFLAKANSTTSTGFGAKAR